ncbi:MAG: hypothetical protein ACXVNF_09525 [Neobacillus sp.]
MDFDYATLIVEESNGFKSWEVNIDGAYSKLTEFMIGSSDKFEIKIITEDSNEYSGKALARQNGFLGTGMLHGF